jgi:hypothetical protein
LPLLRGQAAVFGLHLHGKETATGQAAQDVGAPFRPKLINFPGRIRTAPEGFD